MALEIEKAQTLQVPEAGVEAPPGGPKGPERPKKLLDDIGTDKPGEIWKLTSDYTRERASEAMQDVAKSVTALETGESPEGQKAIETAGDVSTQLESAQAETRTAVAAVYREAGEAVPAVAEGVGATRWVAQQEEGVQRAEAGAEEPETKKAETSEERAKAMEMVGGQFRDLEGVVSRFRSGSDPEALRTELKKMRVACHPDKFMNAPRDVQESVARLASMVGRVDTVIGAPGGASDVDMEKDIAAVMAELGIASAKAEVPTPTAEEPERKASEEIAQVEAKPQAEVGEPRVEPEEAKGAEESAEKEAEAEEPRAEAAAPEAKAEMKLTREQEIAAVRGELNALAHEVMKEDGWRTDEIDERHDKLKSKLFDLQQAGSGEDLDEVMAAWKQFHGSVYGEGALTNEDRKAGLNVFFAEFAAEERGEEGEESQGSGVESQEAAGTAQEGEPSLPERKENPKMEDIEGLLDATAQAFRVEQPQWEEFFSKSATGTSRYEDAVKDVDDVMAVRTGKIAELQASLKDLSKKERLPVQIQIEALERANEIAELRKQQWERQKAYRDMDKRLPELDKEVEAMQAKVDALKAKNPIDLSPEGKALRALENELSNKETERSQIVLHSMPMALSAVDKLELQIAGLVTQSEESKAQVAAATKQVEEQKRAAKKEEGWQVSSVAAKDTITGKIGQALDTAAKKSMEGPGAIADLALKAIVNKLEGKQPPSAHPN